MIDRFSKEAQDLVYEYRYGDKGHYLIYKNGIMTIYDLMGKIYLRGVNFESIELSTEEFGLIIHVLGASNFKFKERK